MLRISNPMFNYENCNQRIINILQNNDEWKKYNIEKR